MAESLRARSSNLSDRRNPSAPLLKMRLENEIVRKREAETRRTDTARSNDKYFSHWNIQNEIFERINHSKPFYQKQSVIIGDVTERRQALQKIYQNDKLKQEQQLMELEREKSEEKWEKMKNKVANFRQCRTAKLRELVEKNEHEQWKTRSDSYKAFESELRNQQLQEMWKKQKELKELEKIQLVKEKETEKLIMEKTAERERQEEEAERKLLLSKKMQLKEELEEQMQLLRSEFL